MRLYSGDSNGNKYERETGGANSILLGSGRVLNNHTKPKKKVNWEILLKALGLLGIPAYAIIAFLQVRIWQRDTLFIFAGVLITLRIIGYARRLYHTWRMDNLKYRKEKRQQKYDDEIFS